MSEDIGKLIDIKDAPLWVRMRKGKNKWFDTFSSIPNGKALVIDGDIKLRECIRQSLSRFQKRHGLFKDLVIRSMTDGDNTKIFIFRPSEIKVEK